MPWRTLCPRCTVESSSIVCDKIWCTVESSSIVCDKIRAGSTAATHIEYGLLQLTQLEILFALYDADNSGTLTVEELTTVLRSSGGRPPPEIIEEVKYPHTPHFRPTVPYPFTSAPHTPHHKLPSPDYTCLLLHLRLVHHTCLLLWLPLLTRHAGCCCCLLLVRHACCCYCLLLTRHAGCCPHPPPTLSPQPLDPNQSKRSVRFAQTQNRFISK